MQVDPGLSATATVFPVSETPGIFHDGALVFGPFRASEIELDPTRHASTDIKVLGVGRNREDVSQAFRFVVTEGGADGGARVACAASSGVKGQDLVVLPGQVTTRTDGLSCTVSPVTGAAWTFEYTGEQQRNRGTADGLLAGLSVESAHGVTGGWEQRHAVGATFLLKGKVIGAVQTLHPGSRVWLAPDLAPEQRSGLAILAAALWLREQYGAKTEG
jgi:hypothetical protein